MVVGIIIYTCILCIALPMDMFVVRVVCLTVFVIRNIFGVVVILLLNVMELNVHDRSKWRRHVNVMGEEVQPYRKTDYIPIIYIYIYILFSVLIWQVLCLIVHVWSFKDCVCCACDPKCVSRCYFHRMCLCMSEVICSFKN